MNEYDIAAIIIVSTIALCALIAALHLYFSDEPETDAEGFSVPRPQKSNFKRGDYVKLRNGLEATVTDVDTTCMRVRINGAEGVSQTYTTAGRHIDYDFLDIIETINHVDMRA